MPRGAYDENQLLCRGLVTSDEWSSGRLCVATPAAFVDSRRSAFVDVQQFRFIGAGVFIDVSKPDIFDHIAIML